jgi:hypothetical protein
MSSGPFVSASIVDGVFVWQQAGEPRPLPGVEQPATQTTAEWSTPVIGFVGRTMVGFVVLACVAWSIEAINLGEHSASTTMAARLDPITTGSIRPQLRPTIGTDEDERTKALARASAISSRQDEVGRRAIDMMCAGCGISRPAEPGGAFARPTR